MTALLYKCVNCNFAARLQNFSETLLYLITIFKQFRTFFKIFQYFATYLLQLKVKTQHKTCYTFSTIHKVNCNFAARLSNFSEILIYLITIFSHCRPSFDNFSLLCISFGYKLKIAANVPCSKVATTL